MNFCDSLKKKIAAKLTLMETKHYSVDEYGVIEITNEALVKNLEALTKNNLFQNCDLTMPGNDTLFKRNYLSYLLSDDKKFCLISWDSEEGGTMIAYSSVAIYKAGNETKIIWMDTGTEYRNSMIFYNIIYTIKPTTKNFNPIYLAVGEGKSGTAEPWQIVKAFQINNSLSDTLHIFPEKKDELFLSYDLFNVMLPDTSNGSVPWIEVWNNGKEIRIPQTDENGNPTFEMKNLFFDGNNFVGKN